MAATFSPIGEPFIATGRRWLPEAKAALTEARARLRRSEVVAAVRGRWPDETPEITQRQRAEAAMARVTSRAKAGRP